MGDFSTKNAKIKEKYDRYLVPNYTPASIILDKGQGSRVWDIEGQEYIDFGGGVAVSAIGHSHIEVIRVLEAQSRKMWHTSNFFANKPAVELAEWLCLHTFAEKVFFANSGTEANEAAIKMARKKTIEGGTAQKHEIISFTNSFHGRSMMMITVGGQEKYRQNFGPLPGGVKYAEFNNLASVKSLISSKTCAVIIEPVMGEGGIYPADLEFLQGVRKLCNQHQALLIFDEIQCGVGRTGQLYAYQTYNIIPDILTTAKALGAGIPISAVLTTDEIASCFVPGSHGSTFGGNPLACQVALTTLKIINSADLLQKVMIKRGIFEKLIGELIKKYPIFKEIRGLGLLIGLEMSDTYADQAGTFSQMAIANQLLVLVAGSNVVRLAPSLLITEEDIGQGMKILGKTMQQMFKSKQARK